MNMPREISSGYADDGYGDNRDAQNNIKGSHGTKEVFKFATAGSVDDGKSTLIGRLLYDTGSLPEDKLAAIRKVSEQKGFDYLDLSFATDGLVAEREQGITIDVAHIYFATKERSYIIADTPGHAEYTRNMVTGASTSSASIMLIDARKGVVSQTKRHFYINHLLGVKDVIVAVNKMDLVGYAEERFTEIKTQFVEWMSAQCYTDQQIHFIPVCALAGDNVVNRSTNMDWYQQSTLIEYLEDLAPESNAELLPVRFPVQMVIRPKTNDYHDFRGYAGKLSSGSLSVGDDVVVLPSGMKSTVSSILIGEQLCETASAGQSITITLADEVNIDRSDMIVKADDSPALVKKVQAKVCWMDHSPLEIGKTYHIQHGVNKVQGRVLQIDHIYSTDSADTGGNQQSDITEVSLNDIADVTFALQRPIYQDRFSDHRHNGRFIIIDSQSNNTAGVGFVQ